MKIIAGLLILVSIVSAIDLRRRHETNHKRRHRRHHHRHEEVDYEDDDWKNYGHGYIVHKACRRSGMVALTFDDGVV